MPGRVQAGRTSDEPVSGIDFYPTICSFMGVNPTDPDKVDGEDLTDLIFAGKSPGERNLFWNFPSYNRPDDPARCPHSVQACYERFGAAKTLKPNPEYDADRVKPDSGDGK
jgi:arylsulfatase A-like enzyme